MSAPFGKSPKLREYIEWARKEADCAIDEGHFGKKSGALEIPCHFCKLKKRNDTCEKNLILM